MEENNNVEVNEEVKEEKKQAVNKQINFSLSETLIKCGFSIIALILFALLRIITAFGVFSAVLDGIMAIIIYSLAIFGAIINLLKTKKLTFELGVSAFVLLLLFL